MKRIETINIDIDSDKLPFRFSVLSFMKLRNEFNLEVTEINSIEDTVNYFYCAYSAGCNYEKVEQKYDLESFWTLIEEYPELIATLSAKLADSNDSKKK